MAKFDFKNYRFEDLEVWKLGMQIVHEVYKLVKKFPRDEIFSLVDQLKRAAISIVLNIAEGSGKSTDKELIRYFDIALGSLNEVLAACDVMKDNNLITEDEFQNVFKKVENISKQLGGFKKRL